MKRLFILGIIISQNHSNAIIETSIENNRHEKKPLIEIIEKYIPHDTQALQNHDTIHDDNLKLIALNIYYLATREPNNTDKDLVTQIQNLSHEKKNQLKKLFNDEAFFTGIYKKREQGHWRKKMHALNIYKQILVTLEAKNALKYYNKEIKKTRILFILKRIISKK